MTDAEVTCEGGGTTEVKRARTRLDEAVAIISNATDEAEGTGVRSDQGGETHIDRSGETDGAVTELVVGNKDGTVAQGQAREGRVEVRALRINRGRRKGRHDDGVVNLTGPEVVVAGGWSRGRPVEVTRVDELGVRNHSVGANAVRRRVWACILHLETAAAALVVTRVDNGVITCREVDRAEGRVRLADAFTAHTSLGGIFSGNLHAIDGQTALVVLRYVKGVDATRGDLQGTGMNVDRVRQTAGDVGDDRRGKALNRHVTQEGTRHDDTGGLGGIRHVIQRSVGTTEFAAEGSGQTTLREARRSGRAIDRLDRTVDDVRNHEHRKGRTTVDGDGLAGTKGSPRSVGELSGAVITRGRTVERGVERNRRTGGEGIIATQEDAAIARVDRTGRVGETASDERQVGISRGEDLQARSPTREECAGTRKGHVIRRATDAGDVKHRVRGDVQRTHQDRVDLIVGSDVDGRRRQTGVNGDVITKGDDSVVAKVRAQRELATIHGDGASTEDIRLAALLEADQRAIVEDDTARSGRLRLGVVAPTGRRREAVDMAEPECTETFLCHNTCAADATAEDHQSLRRWDINRRVRRQRDIPVEVEATEVLEGEAAINVQLVGEVGRTSPRRKEGARGHVERRKAQRTLEGTTDTDVGPRGGRGQRRTDGEISVTRDRRDDRASGDAGAADFHADKQTVREGGRDDRLAHSPARSGGNGKHERLVEAKQRLHAGVSRGRVAQQEATGIKVEGTRDLVAARELQHARPRLGDGRGVR